MSTNIVLFFPLMFNWYIITTLWKLQKITNWYWLSWARPAVLTAGNGRVGNVISSVPSLPFIFLFHLFYYIFSPFLRETTQWPTRVDVSLNPNTVKKNNRKSLQKLHPVPFICHLSAESNLAPSLEPNLTQHSHSRTTVRDSRRESAMSIQNCWYLHTQNVPQILCPYKLQHSYILFESVFAH